MKENWELLAVLAAVSVYVGHELLHSGLWESVPGGYPEQMAVGLGLAVLAAVGIGVNSYAYEEM